ncbi:putative secreted protein [Rhodopirellula maiorica SM1]|uniref:Putative secreted protein n=1 Tax=Rhodopirellula maiorica SM1 TaxID=1265738 RepID=M5S4K1_9BACT|nr:hypothetical protein [Rhodopirellula maiorica]EMI22572.1 putative secreted protein [Rhodopirellula maiorica SM1]
MTSFRIANVLTLTILVLSSAGAANAETPNPIDRAWEVTWSRFYREDTHLFYDYLTRYEDGNSLSHLPTAEEVQRQFPNECGYGTGMEDCMISAGVMLSMIIDRYEVTKEESLRQRAYHVFKGIQLCATAYGDKGFLARGVCHEDLKSIYMNSSRDQYTHAVHGLWHYANSPLCSEDTLQEIRVIVAAIANRMIRNVTAENDYDLLRADGSRDTRGISRMWNVKGHEAARLPMIYAAAWDITGKPSYHELWRHYIADAVKQSFAVESGQPTYAFLQMQISLDLLWQMEPDPQLKQQMHEVMTTVAQRCADRATAAERRAKQLDLTRLCTDWRTGEGISSTGSYRPIWYCIRESGEAALAQLVANASLSESQQQTLRQSIERLDYDRVSSNGIFFLQAAYWKSKIPREMGLGKTFGRSGL